MIQEMVAITQRDVPYVVITYDANLQAYRTDTIDNVVLSCPEDETGDIMCEQAGYAPLLSLAPGSAARRRRRDEPVAGARDRRRDRLRRRRLAARLARTPAPRRASRWSSPE